MLILLWLLPAVVVTSLAAVWVARAPKERPQLTQAEAAEQIGAALARGSRAKVGRF